ncbi:ATP-binding protein [Salmonella enterica subsp. enterica]|uniref:ATP-binding protein n=1 Tax=Salmonella enterica I TaxID=59201 RepID=A0A379WTF9_SALET|nr:ATP-binding protein [Salmonella enterica subsp. enterica]
MLRKAVGKGAYEMAWSQQENAPLAGYIAKP